MRARERGGWNGLLCVALAAVGWCWLAHRAGAELAFQTLYTSTPNSSTVPYSALAQAAEGSFYGTIPSSGTGGYGSILRITPSGGMMPVFLFSGINGSNPEGGLVLAANGSLYGTTTSGGLYGVGTFFKLTPPAPFQTLHSFNGSDGAYPYFSLIQAHDGFLYGVTVRGSTNPATIFRASAAGAVTTLTNFPGAMGGLIAEPTDGLVQGPDDWLYGTTRIFTTGSQKAGSIFQFSTNGIFQTLVYFNRPLGAQPPTVADQPIGGLTAGTDGFLYGTIGHDVSPTATHNGSVFRMTTNGVLTGLIGFAGTNGSNPMTRLLLAKDGAFYGLTTDGGPGGGGTIFRVTTNGVLSTLAGGFGAYAVYLGPPSLTQGSDGNLYGTGLTGGASALSALVFRLVPPPLITSATWSSGALTLTWNSFTNGVYRLAYASDVNATSWTTQASTITATGNTTSASDYPGTAAQRFYKVMLLP